MTAIKLESATLMCSCIRTMGCLKHKCGMTFVHGLPPFYSDWSISHT